MSDTIEVFISYSKDDKELCDKLLTHLRLLKKQGIITWFDRQILPGTQWDDEIKARLNTADIILLLISADFLATDYCTETEIPAALRRHQSGEAIVMPVILRACTWEDYTPLAAIQAYPEKAKPINTWAYIDEAYTSVVRGVSLAAKEIKKRRSQQQQEAEQEKLRQAEQLRQQQEESARLEQEELERQRQTEEQERLRQTEQLRQQQEESAGLEQEELDRQRQKQLKGKYVQLQALLKTGNWQDADQETTRQMLQIMKRQKEGWLRAEDIQQFPCADLHTIDKFWVEFSKGKFGFSVQKKIWQECGSPMENDANWEKFGARVRWRKGLLSRGWLEYDKLAFNTSAPNGHLPSGWLTTVIVGFGKRGIELGGSGFLLSHPDL